MTRMSTQIPTFLRSPHCDEALPYLPPFLSLFLSQSRISVPAPVNKLIRILAAAAAAAESESLYLSLAFPSLPLSINLYGFWRRRLSRSLSISVSHFRPRPCQ